MNSSQWNLGDVQLELVDPTPNIHSLFVQFNSKFFWGKLDSVSVRWSKRMFSCAGICRYEGRGGLCDIGLSEPLLKLRPRKDLVETLLHEMIHAYLFVAERDRDRDGHGPNFQHHMHRINKAANINISIYHNFHDEVRIYLRHWWRCDGPCQHKKPFFGLVKRSSNRAPGPNDFWWQQHQSNCGGKFIKIKEPEKPNKTEKKKNKENITKNSDNKVPVNVITISDLPSTSQSSSGSKLNGGKTIVVTKRVSDALNTPERNPKRKTLIDYWSGKGNTLKSDKQVDKNYNVMETVRNHWANKDLDKCNKIISNIESSIFETHPKKVATLNTTLSNERVSPPCDLTLEDAEALLKDIYGDSFTLNKAKYEKKFSPPKTNHGNSIKAIFKIEDNVEIAEMVDCPSCNKKVQNSQINEHLDVCTNQPYLTECSSCHVMVENISTHSPVCHDKNIPDFVECPSCQEIVCNINEHLDICLEHNKEIIEPNTVSCPHCESKVPKWEINKHIDNCLTDDSKTGEIKCCPVCNAQVSESLEDHLEVCSALMDTFHGTDGQSVSLDDDDFNDSVIYNASGTMLPCPCCMKMIEGNLMNSHINECLNL